MCGEPSAATSFPHRHARRAMPPASVHIRVARDVPFPLDAAYAWLTDYQDDDPGLTTAIVKKRPVVERRGNVVVLDGEIEVAGRRTAGRAEVHLFPPDRWEARFEKGSVYRYRLTPRGPAACRLDVDYAVRTRRWKGWLLVQLAKPKVKAEIHTMWDGFLDAMAKDLAAAPTA